MSLSLVIVGAGGFARELCELLPDVFPADQFPLRGFLGQDDRPITVGESQWPVLGDPVSYEPQTDERFLLAIGDIGARRRVVEAIEGRGGEFETFVHPLARVASTASIGRGAVIYPFAVVSNQSTLQPHVHLNYYASVGHDGQVGRFCLLAPYATLNGCVTLEDDVYISTHGTVAPGRRIGAGSKLSANSACMQDAPARTLAFGVPARQVPRLD